MYKRQAVVVVVVVVVVIVVVVVAVAVVVVAVVVVVVVVVAVVVVVVAVVVVVVIAVVVDVVVVVVVVVVVPFLQRANLQIRLRIIFYKCKSIPPSKTSISFYFLILLDSWKSPFSALGPFGPQLCFWTPRGWLQEPFCHQNNGFP